MEIFDTVGHGQGGWADAATGELDAMIDLRRAIHREPELGLQNPKTLAKIKQALAGLPLEFRRGRRRPA